MTTNKSLIAVIDDDADVLNSLGRLLRALGYAVLSFSSGREYLSAMELVRPDCILLDMQMPEMNGMEVQAELSRRKPQLPVIFMTAHHDAVAYQAAERAGAPLLLKPFPESVLLAVVQSLIPAAGH